MSAIMSAKIAVFLLASSLIVAGVSGQASSSTSNTEVTMNIGGLVANNTATTLNSSESDATTATTSRTTIISTDSSTQTDGNVQTTPRTTSTRDNNGAGSSMATPPSRPMNATNATKNCPSLTPADVDITEIQGVWYVQAYTAGGSSSSSDNSQITQCDVFKITIDTQNRRGTIVYTFIEKGDNHSTSEVADIVLLPQPSQFFYNVSGVDISMTTTIVVFRKNDTYVHLACPSDDTKNPTLVIATKQRNVPDSDIVQLIQEAAKHGAATNVRSVKNDGVTCPEPDVTQPSSPNT